MKHYLVSCAILPLALASLPAFAQDASEQPQDSGGIGEIVVTAQKRAENVQDVPIAISAFGGETLRERSVGDVAQLSNAAPNVTLDAGTPFSGSSSVLSAFIRGIGANDFAMNIDPGVGIYLDGVYLARTVGANLDLPDVERIEVLKGPQGTLFGRNTIGGAISVVTRTPGEVASFQGDVTTGRSNRLDVRGYADLPLAETLRSSITFSMKSRDGYQKRIPYPAATPFVTDNPRSLPQSGYQTASREGSQNEWTLRGKLLWEASDRFRATLGGDYMRINQSSMANSVLAVTSGVPGPFAGLAANNIPGTALDVATGASGFLFAGLYNFCIGASAADLAARNAAALCDIRGTSLNPSSVLPPLAGVNVDANPNNDRLPYDNRWISADKDMALDDPDWIFRWGMLDYDAGYELINDNLLDLCHLSYVHAASFGTDESWANTRPRIEMLAEGVRSSRWIENSPPIPPLGRAAGVDKVDIWTSYDFVLPGVFLLYTAICPAGTAEKCNREAPGEDSDILFSNFTSQAVVPTSATTARYYFAWGPPREHGTEADADVMIQVAYSAFNEDKVMIEAQQRIIDLAPSRRPVPTTADKSITLFTRLMHAQDKPTKPVTDSATA